MLLNILNVVLIVLVVVTSIALTAVILLQSGKEAGLSGAIAGNSESYMNKGNRKSLDKILASATKWVALVWVLAAFGLCLM